MSEKNGPMDQVVLDYLQRKYPSLAPAFQKAASPVPLGQPIFPLEVMMSIVQPPLDENYRKSLKSKHPVRTAKKVQPSTTINVLPVEILTEIAKYMGWKTLLKLRLVSSQWNAVSCRRIGQLDVPVVNLCEKSEFVGFKQTMSSCNMPLLPFRSYSIVPIEPHASLFLKKSRDQIKKLKLSNSVEGRQNVPHQNILSFLRHVPNVEKLWINIGKDMEDDREPITPNFLPLEHTFLKLRFLSIRYELDGYSLPPLSPTMVLRLLAQCPELEVLRTKNPLSFPTTAESLTSFSNHIQNSKLKKFETKKVPGIWDMENFGHVSSLSFLWTRDVQTLACGIVKLGVNLSDATELNLPQMPTLEMLFIKFGTQRRVVSALDPTDFPALRKVRLHFDGNWSQRSTTPFSGNIFPLVDTLVLEEPGTTEGMNTSFLWHHIFPELRSLKMFDPRQADMDYIALYLTNLVHIYFDYNFIADDDLNFGNSPRLSFGSINKWPFKNLKHLKRLEIENSLTNRPIEVEESCYALLKWTEQNKIPRLDYLGFYYLPERMEAKVKREFSRTLWHNKVSFRKY